MILYTNEMHIKSYIAGLFDGEGWFVIAKGKRSDTIRGYAYQTHARIDMRHVEPLLLVQSKYGGTIRKVRQATETHAAIYAWNACGESAWRFAKSIKDFLLIKRKQAELVIQFQDLKRKHNFGPCSDERWKSLTSLYEKMIQLNRKGPRND